MSRRCLLLCCLLLLVAGPVAAADGDCAETGAKIDAKIDALSSQVSTDMRRLRREIAALKAQSEEPGMKEIVAGLGYISGLFGVAFFVAGRRRKG
jgi:nickel transport protein